MKPRIRHNRESVVSRIGEVLRRRHAPEEPAHVPTSLKSGGVVQLNAEAEPITEMLLNARLMGRPHRQTEYLHVSDLLSKCVRKIAIVESLNLPQKPQALSLTDSITYAQGDAIADVMKARIAAGSGGKMWGHWACRCLTTVTKSPRLLSEVDLTLNCVACGTPMTNYREVPMKNEQYKIVGTPDVLTLFEQYKALYVTELKSISHDRWLTLVRPDPLHVLQVMFYWFLMRELGYRLMSRVSVVYTTKGWIFGKNPWKEFTLDVPSQLQRLDSHLQDALKIQEARSGGELPARPCSSDQVTEAKKCEVCRTCFGATNAPVEISITQALGGATARKIR